MEGDRRRRGGALRRRPLFPSTPNAPTFPRARRHAAAKADGNIMTDRLTYGAVEDRTMPAIVYALYLIGIANGVTVLLGLILALANRRNAGAKMRTHYTFLIRTCWLWLVWMVIAGALILWGIPLSLLLVGFPMMALGWLIFGLDHIWFALRAILGVIYLARDEPYPRPNTWLL
jgi:uncharacterized membrane protein